jgi:hypothetical protein
MFELLMIDDDYLWVAVLLSMGVHYSLQRYGLVRAP